MVLGNLTFTVAPDGKAKGTKGIQSRKANKANTAASVTLATEGELRDTERDKVERSREGSAGALFDYSDDDDDGSVDPTPISANEGVVETIEVATAAAASEVEDESDALTLDPTTSERQYYGDAGTNIQREIWRPGDGDGLPGTDYFDRKGPLPPGAQRWRFYQLKTGSGPLNKKTNVPPKYVILDDRAAYEVLASDIAKTAIVKWWSHDFGGPGRIRVRRPHRGRGAIRDPHAEGDSRYHQAPVGMKTDIYSFTGEKDYTPIIYRTPPSHPRSRKRKSPTRSPSSLSPTSKRLAKEPRRHGHNQHTPHDQLVRFGAPSQAKGKGRYRARINTFLRRSATPPFAKDRAKLYGGIAGLAHAAGSVGGEMVAGRGGSCAVVYGEVGGGESLWVEQEGEEEVLVADGEEGEEGGARFAEAEEGAYDEFPSPVSRFAAEGQQTSEGDEEELPEPDTAELARRTKFPRPMSYMQRMASAPIPPDTSTITSTSTSSNSRPPNAHDKLPTDSGSYASQLEISLKDATDEIDRLSSIFQQAQARVRELEEEIAALREEKEAARAAQGDMGDSRA